MQANYKPIKWETAPGLDTLLKLKAIFETGGDGQFTNELNIINEGLAQYDIKLIDKDREPAINQTIPL